MWLGGPLLWRRRALGHVGVYIGGRMACRGGGRGVEKAYVVSGGVGVEGRSPPVSGTPANTRTFKPFTQTLLNCSYFWVASGYTNGTL